MAVDLSTLTIKNAATHLSAASVSRGVAHAVLFKRAGTTEIISLGIVTSLTPVRDRQTDDFKVPNTLEGGPQVTLFTEVTSVTRGEDFTTVTRDLDVLGLHAGSTPDKVAATGAYKDAPIFDNGAEGVNTGAALRITNSGAGSKSRVVFRPGATLTGTGETTDTTAPGLEFELRGAPSGVTWKVPAALMGAVDVVYPWGVTFILNQADVGPAAKILFDSIT
ncbi:hypothetical protein [Deinococcus fonticola]|uniref:hypothetical protein n=1 Tax=Deinococcus fonticola TaxID=2528713 RepID=UPI00107506CC|nr:hypothetical protein [Deinococcus fonticola]